jgi:hypothetical protein
MHLIEKFKKSKYYNLSTLLNLLMVLNIIFMIKIAYFLTFFYYLPPPFYYDSNNSFFDFFEIGRLSFMPMLYDNISPNYLPFVFGLGRLFSPLNCDLINPYNYRYCALPSILWMLCFYVIAAFSLGYYLSRAHIIQSTKFNIAQLSLITLTSPMLLYAFERGNYIILTLWLLLIYEFTNKVWLRIILAILLINLKIYMLILLFPMFLKRHFKNIVIILFGVIASNFFISNFFNFGFHWYNFIFSLFHFEAPTHISGHESIGFLTEHLWTNVSIENLLKVTSQSNLVTACQYVGQISCNILTLLSYLHLNALWKLNVAVFSGATILIMAWLFRSNKLPSLVTEEMMFFYLIISLMMFVSHIGTYVLILIIPYVFLLPRYSLGVIISFIILFSTLTDIPFYPSSVKEYFSFISQTYFTARHTIQLSSYLRPLALTYLFYFYTKVIFNAYLSVPKRLRPL